MAARRPRLGSVALLLALLACRAADAQILPDDVSSLPWVFEGGGVSVAQQVGSTVYVGGDFTGMARRSHVIGPLGVFDATSAHLLAADPSLTGGTVTAVSADGTGGWFLGGQFVVDGQPRYLLRIDAAGRRLPWGPDVGGAAVVSALARSGPTLVVAGTFSSVGGQPRSNIATIDIPTQQVSSWNPGVIGEGDPNRRLVVRSLHLEGGRLYVAGGFHEVGGQRRFNVAAVDLTSGAVTAWAPNVESPITAIRASGSRVFIGGGYLFHVNGVPRYGLAALDAVSGNVLPLAPDIRFWTNDSLGNRGVLAITASGDTVYLGGRFIEVNGVVRWGAAAIDASTGAVLPWAPLSTPAGVHALTLRGSDVFVAGERWFVPEGLAMKVDAISGVEDRGWRPAIGAAAFAVAVDGDRVAVGGRFSAYHALRATGLAAFDLVTGNAVPVPRVDGTVRSMLAVGNTVFFGGNFTEVSGQPRTSFAAFDATSGVVTPFAPTLTVSGYVYVDTLAVDGGDLYFGGLFTAVDGQPRSSVASVDVETGALRPFVVELANDSFVGSVVAKNGRAWVNGTPFSAAGTPLGAPWDQLRVSGALGNALYGEHRFGLAFTRMDALSGALDTWSLPIQVTGRITIGCDAVFAQAVGQPSLFAFDQVTGQQLPWVHSPTPPADRLAASDVTDGLLVREYVSFDRTLTTGYFARRSSVTAPEAVSDAGVHVQGNLVTLRWTPSPNPAGALPTAYRVVVGSQPGASDLATLEFPRTSTGFSTLAPSGLYYLRIVSTANGVAGPPSRELAFVVGVAGCATAPASAPQLTVTPGPSPVLEWSAPDGVTVGGYTLRVGAAPGLHGLAAITLPAAQTSFATAGAPAGVYYAVVVATSACGIPLASNEVQIVVPAATPPAPPTGLAAQVTGSTVALSWTAPAGVVTGYVLEAGSASGLSNLVPGLALGPAPALVVPGIPPGRYFVRVRAANGALSSAPSSEIVVDVP